MIRQYEHAVFSLHSLASLIRIAGKDAQRDFEKLSAQLEELKKGDATHLVELSKTVESLLSRLEEVKAHARRLEHRDLSTFKEFLRACAHEHLFSLLPSEASREVREKIEQVISFVNRELRAEVKKERRVRKGKNPQGTFFKRLFSTKSLAHREVRESRLLSHLEGHEKDSYTQAVQSISYIVAKNGAISPEEFQHVAKLIIAYVDEVEDEVQLELDIEENAELQEVKLEQELEELSDIKNKDVKAVFEKLHNDYTTCIRKDIREAKIMRKEDELVLEQEGTKKADSASEDAGMARLLELAKDPSKHYDFYKALTEVIASKEIYDRFVREGKLDLLISTLAFSPDMFKVLSTRELFYSRSSQNSGTDRNFDPGLTYVTSRVMKRFESDFPGFYDQRTEHENTIKTLIAFINNVSTTDSVRPTLKDYFKIDMTLGSEPQKYIIVKHMEHGHVVFTLFSRKLDDYQGFNAVWPESSYFRQGKEPQHAGLSKIFGYEHKLPENQYRTITGAHLSPSEKAFFGTSEAYGGAGGGSSVLAKLMMEIHGDSGYK